MTTSCPVCRRTVKVTPTGYIKSHNRPGGTPCDGSGRAHEDKR